MKYVYAIHLSRHGHVYQLGNVLAWLTKTPDSGTAFCNPYVSHIQTAIHYAALATICIM